MNLENNRPFRVVWPLMISQTIGAFNDNAMKAMLPVMAAVQFGKVTMDSVNQQVSILLILPFVIFAPLAGWICDRFSKRLVIRYTLLAQLLGLWHLLVNQQGISTTALSKKLPIGKRRMGNCIRGLGPIRWLSAMARHTD